MADHEHNPPYPIEIPKHLREKRDRKYGKAFTIMDVVVSGDNSIWIKIYDH